MAFPVFGRGRALQGVTGPSITETGVVETCAFLSGNARGEAKRAGPGRDLLFTAAWNSLFRPPAPPQALLHPKAEESPEEEGPIAEAPLPGNGMAMRVGFGIAAAALALILASLLVLLWRRRNR